MVPTVPTVPPGSRSYLGNFPNEYRFDIEVSNRGRLLITDIFVTLKVDSLAVNAGAAVDPAITWITSNNVGDLQPVSPSGVLDCFTNHTDQDIGIAFSPHGAVAGNSVEYTVRVTATDSFGPVSDDKPYIATIAP